MNLYDFSTNACLGSISQHFSQTRLGQRDRLVFEFDHELKGYEITALSRISMRYQGRATDRELSMIGDICDRVGIAEGVK